MKFKILIFLFFLLSCTGNYTKFENRETYNSKGFAYLYNEEDLEKKIIKGKLNNEKLQISHGGLKINTLVKINNPKNNKSLILKNLKRTNYPDIYKILMTKPVFEKLELSYDFPLVEITELKKNESFVAQKAKIFNEEKKLTTNAPVASVKISNISKENKKQKKIDVNKREFFILIASFSSKDIAIFLKDRIIKELPQFEKRKLIVKKINNNKINLISGPYKTINFMKNDYILLKKFGFEELDITLND